MVDLLKLSSTKTLLGIFNRFVSSLLHRKSIIILIGDAGVYLAAFVQHKVVDTLFITAENKETTYLYEDFFQKYKKFHIFFLLDSAECNLRHDIIPVFSSIVKTNPVEKFITEYFSTDDLVGYSVYNINTKTNETWNTMLISYPYKPPLSNLLDSILSKGQPKFGGLYFLTLEFVTILDTIVQRINDNQYAEYLQIVVCILETSGIKLIVKHHGNIISVKNTIYPPDKSESYIQGIIEQEIEDCLISLKHYIESYKPQVCIIFIVEQSLASLLNNSKFGEHQVICKTVSSISEHDSNKEEKFFDNEVISLFNSHKSCPASNQNLITISKLNVISAIIFKPLIVLIIAMISMAGLLKIKTIENYKKVDILSTQYFEAEKHYYSLKQKYPYIKNATNLADLYVFEALLQIPVPTPFDLLEKFFANLDKNFSVNEIKWERLDLDNMSILTEKHIQVTILLEFTTKGISVENTKKLLAQHIVNFNEIFKPMQISNIIFTDQIIDLSQKVVIPLLITIKN